MTETIKPRDAAQLRDAIAWAAAEEAPLELRAGGSRRGRGRPVAGAPYTHLPLPSHLRAVSVTGTAACTNRIYG